MTDVSSEPIGAAPSAAPFDILIVGGGMITADLILPSVYHLQRTGRVGRILISARTSEPLRALQSHPDLARAFPGSTFEAHPSLSTPPQAPYPDLYREVIASLASRQMVIVAVPDALHYTVVREALTHEQHVLCVKPLVLHHAEAIEIANLARDRGLFVGVEYHKRFDRRALVARRAYREGRFGEFMMGEARLYEPYYYRHSNFQTWFTCEATDPFTYVGCHYVDLVSFITGLRPTSVSVDGVRRAFPNGQEGYLWSSGRVRYENGAMLTVTDGLGYPDAAAGMNDQGLVMYCEGADATGLIDHDDHQRGVRYASVSTGGVRYRYVSPDFFQLVPWEGSGYRPIGYGYDSIAANVRAARHVDHGLADLTSSAAIEERRKRLAAIDAAGLLATPANSSTNELVIEAARRSIVNDGVLVPIVYDEPASVRRP